MVNDSIVYPLVNISIVFKKVKHINTKQSNKRNNQNSKDKTIT